MPPLPSNHREAETLVKCIHTKTKKFNASPIPSNHRGWNTKKLTDNNTYIYTYIHKKIITPPLPSNHRGWNTGKI